MIGNSPKSDVNPALDAGMNAVLVPHPHTLGAGASGSARPDRRPARFLQVERFSDLRLHFETATANSICKVVLICTRRLQ